MSTFIRRTFLITIGLILMLLISACGGTSNTGAAQSTPTSTPTPTPPSTIKTAKATVDGKSETILTDAKGMTLYYFTPDSPTKLACTDKCAIAWPPLVSTKTPTSSAQLPGALSLLTDANGSQVEYSGYLLYTYVKDLAPGQITGQGVGNVWYVATPEMSSYLIRVTSNTVDGKTEKIFTNALGLPLYYFTPDAPTKLACSGGCAQAWPPLVTKNSSDTPLADVPLTGTLTVLNDANGNQIEYNGHLLYTYVKDTEGVITGQGVNGKWYIATPDLAAA